MALYSSDQWSPCNLCNFIYLELLIKIWVWIYGSGMDSCQRTEHKEWNPPVYNSFIMAVAPTSGHSSRTTIEIYPQPNPSRKRKTNTQRVTRFFASSHPHTNRLSLSLHSSSPIHALNFFSIVNKTLIQ